MGSQNGREKTVRSKNPESSRESNWHVASSRTTKVNNALAPRELVSLCSRIG